MGWRDQLQTASWKGVSFHVDDTTNEVQRRLVAHEYPMRDVPWIEDLGRGLEKIGLRAFLVGDSVFSDRDNLYRVCDESGEGTLVHPSRGTLTCILQSAGFGERRDLGNVIEVQLSFLVLPANNSMAWPNVTESVFDKIVADVFDLQTSEVASFFSKVSRGVQSAQSVMNGVISTTNQYTSLINRTIGSATSSINAVSGIVGTGSVSLGRYSRGNGASTLRSETQGLQGVSGALNSASRIGTAFTQATSAANSARALVTRGASDLNRLAGLFR